MPPIRPSRGFTLVELMIVLVIIAILATIAVSTLLGAKISANETAAIATLTQLVRAQAQFTTRQAADEDHNGVGEYGTFAELAGSLPVRQAAGGTRTLEPRLISPAFGMVSGAGEITRSGYHFRLYLPDASGVGVPELAGGGASPQVDAARSEGLWCVYAWPQAYESTGRRTFFANQSGNISFTENAAYSGVAAPVAAGAAFSSAGAPTHIDGSPAVNETGRDGSTWLAVGN